MHSSQIWGCCFISLVIYSKTNGACSNDGIKRPVVAALLDLHGGEDCQTVNFHGLQQLATLRNTLDDINVDFLPDRIEIDLLVLDTCSTEKGTRIATLKALVAAEQTCINTPLFLGFIGNDNKENFEVTKNISKVFNMAQVIPHSFGSNGAIDNNAHYVSSYPIEQHTEAVKILLTKIGIENVVVLYENTMMSRSKVNHMVENLNDSLCLIDSVPLVDINYVATHLKKGSNQDAILILIENVKILEEFSDLFVKSNEQMIISLGKVGFNNYLFTAKNPSYVLQFSSLAPLGNLSRSYDEDLVKSYNEQQLLKCSKIMDKYEKKCNVSVLPAHRIADKDWTTNLLRYGLMLYGNSLRIAAYKKCKEFNGSQGLCSKLNSLPQKDWNEILKESKMFIKAKSGSRSRQINFNMEIGGQYKIYLVENSTSRLIGRIEKGLEVEKGYEFPVQEAKPPVKCSGASSAVTVKATANTTPATEDQPRASLLPTSDIFDLDWQDYEMIGFLSGVVFGILFLISLMFYIVYATMSVKSSGSNSSSRGSVRSRISND